MTLLEYAILACCILAIYFGALFRWLGGCCASE